MLPEYDSREIYERNLISDPKSSTTEGYCYICKQEVHFQFDYLYSYSVDGILTPNWRERLVCPVCSLNNRMRASIHLFEHLLSPDKNTAVIYIAEQVSALSRWLFKNYANVTSSEYFGEYIPFGTNRHGIRNEDITNVTLFPILHLTMSSLLIFLSIFPISMLLFMNVAGF